MKKIYLKLSILISIAIIGLIYSCNLYSDKETILNDVKLKEKVETNDLFAIKVETVGNDNIGTGEYTDETNIPLKENGYIFNREKSGCMNADGHLLNDVLTYRNNMIKVDVTGTTYCYLYFDYLDNADNFCVSQGITNLSDCLLVMDNYSLDREEAIDYINSKTYDTTKTSPSYIFKMETQENVDNSDKSVIGGRTSWLIGTSYTFDEESGIFRTVNYSTRKLEESDVGKYTCGGTTSCSSIYKINAVEENGIYQYITNLDLLTYEEINSFDSETGIYATTDADGPTYFYRGNVTNNNVQFGGYYWKVVRINGDGSIRLIYAGTSATESGEDDQIGTSAYNTKYWHPMYAGYKYTDSDLETTETISTGSRILTPDRIYYFADSYIDNGNGTFKLSGNMIQGTWQEVYESGDWEEYHYTVLGTSSTTTARTVNNITGWSNNSALIGTFIQQTPKSYESTLRNETDSTIKTYIDSWYENNLLNATDTSGNNIVDYIYQDAKYCNDRSIYQGNGIYIVPTNYYSYLKRRYNNAYSLMCNQNQDIFSKSNDNLDYPIALLNADEAALSGILTGHVNNNNFLTTGTDWWTMTPEMFETPYMSQRNMVIRTNGNINDVYSLSSTTIGVRPVINLKSNVKITSGNGTTSNPYQLAID